MTYYGLESRAAALFFCYFFAREKNIPFYEERRIKAPF